MYHHDYFLQIDLRLFLHLGLWRTDRNKWPSECGTYVCYRYIVTKSHRDDILVETVSSPATKSRSDDIVLILEFFGKPFFHDHKCSNVNILFVSVCGPQTEGENIPLLL
jgi:hypothetical protein